MKMDRFEALYNFINLTINPKLAVYIYIYIYWLYSNADMVLLTSRVTFEKNFLKHLNAYKLLEKWLTFADKVT